jgi:hypothetical protein
MERLIKDTGYFDCENCESFSACNLDMTSVDSLYELKCGYCINDDERKKLSASLVPEIELCPNCGSSIDKVEFVERKHGEIFRANNGKVYALNLSADMEYVCPVCHKSVSYREVIQNVC